MVLYNEYNPDDEAIGAVSAADLRSRPDAVIVVGTSLKVPGIRRLAKELCAVTRGRRDGFTAWINCDPEPVGIDFKDSWDLVVRGECDDVARHVGLPRWDDKDPGDYALVTSEGVTSQKTVVAVEVEVSPQMPTPGGSPKPSSASVSVVIPIPSKQSQLSFAKAVVVKESKTKKKPGKKSMADAHPKNPIKNAFTTSKATKASSTVKADELGFPNPALDNQAMCHVTPTDHRTNYSDMYQPNKEPSTAVQEDKLSHSQHATISPKGGKPTGMERMID